MSRVTGDRSLILGLSFFCLLVTTAGAQTISTIAGNPGRTNVDAQDVAAIPFLAAAATDPGGTLYVASMFTVYRFSGDVATRVAGNGTQGPTVPGEVATNTRLFQIGAIAVAANGDLYVADQSQLRVFRVRAATGLVELFAGGGPQQGVSNVPAANLQLEAANGLEVDGAGRVYIGDGARVYRVDPVTGIATHIAGNGSSTFSGDNGPATAAGLNCSDVTVDAANNVYCADGARIRRIDPAGPITTFAGTGTAGSTGNGGPALSAQISASELAIAGNVLLFSEAFRVRAINLSTTVVSAVAGTGVEGFSPDGTVSLNAQLRSVVALAASPGVAFITDFNVARRISGGVINTVAFNNQKLSGLGGQAVQAQIGFVQHLARDPAGNIYFATTDQVLRVTPAGILTLIAGDGSGRLASGDGEQATTAVLANIGGIAVDATHLYVTQLLESHRIRRVNLSTGIIQTFAGAGPSGFNDGTLATAQFSFPSGLLRDGTFLYIADSGNRRIRRIDLSAATPSVVTFAGNGDNTHGTDGGGALTTGISQVQHLGAGNGVIYYADSIRVRKIVSESGTNRVRDVAGNGNSGVPDEGDLAINEPLSSIGGIAVQPNGSNANKVFIASVGLNRVWVVDDHVLPNGFAALINTLAGTGQIVTFGAFEFGDFAGDGGPAGLAALNRPGGVVAETTDRLVVADRDNFRLRRITGLGNSAPTLIPIVPPSGVVSIPEDSSTSIGITVGDEATTGTALVLTAASANPALVAQTGLTLTTINATTRALTIVPQANAVGNSVITLTLVDTQGGVTRRSFNFTTTPVNDPPTIQPIADITMPDAAPFLTTVVLSDIDGPGFNLNFTSSNQTVLPNANLAMLGGGSTRTLSMTPIAGVGGTTTVTVTLSDGLASAMRSFAVTVVLTPQAPTLTSAEIDGFVAELEWEAAAGGITPLAYQIEAGVAPGKNNVSASITGRARRFALPLPATGTWFVRVLAVNGVALSPPSAEATLNVTGVSGRPRNLTAVVNGNLATLRWTLPTNGTRTGYRLDLGTASGLSNLPPLAVPPTLTGLTVVASGTTFVRLVALNGAGASTPSNEIRLVVGGQPGPPAAPTDVQVGVDGTTAVFHWQSPATGGAPLQFVLDAGANTPGQFNLVTGIPFGSGFTLAASAPPGTYNVQLRALNAGGSGPGSSELFVTLPSAAFVPSPPALLRANVEPSRLVTLAWTPPFAGVATSYLLEAGTGPGLANLVVFPIGPTPLFQVGAPPGTFFVRVRAVNSAGVSAVSNEIVVVVP